MEAGADVSYELGIVVGVEHAVHRNDDAWHMVYINREGHMRRARESPRSNVFKRVNILTRVDLVTAQGTDHIA